MVTIHDKGSDNVRLRSGSCHVMIKKTSIWVPMCKEKRMKNTGEGNFRYTEGGDVGHGVAGRECWS